MVPLLTGLLKLPQHKAHGTSLAIVIFVASAGLVGYWITDNIDWSIALWIGLGSVSGVYLGARVMSKISPRILRLIFGVFLLSVAVRMFIV